MTKSPPFTRSVPLLLSLHWLPVNFGRVFKISLLTCKRLHEKGACTSSLHCFPHHSHPVIMQCDQAKELVCQSLGSRPQARAQEHFYSCCFISLEQPPAVSPFTHFSWYLLGSISKTHLLWLGLSPYWHQHTRWPVDVTELLHRFCCWTPIQLLHATEAGFAHRYWCSRNLIDWLIDWKL